MIARVFTLLLVLVLLGTACDKGPSLVGTWVNTRPPAPGIPPGKLAFARDGTLQQSLVGPDGEQITAPATYVLQGDQLTLTWGQQTVEASGPSTEPVVKVSWGKLHEEVEVGTIEFASDDEFTLTIDGRTTRYRRAKQPKPAGGSTK